LANSASSKKRIRQTETRTLRNRAQRSRLRTAVKRVLGADDAAQAQEELVRTAAMLDRYAARRLIHPNKAARKKSQLARHVRELAG